MGVFINLGAQWMTSESCTQWATAPDAGAIVTTKQLQIQHTDARCVAFGFHFQLKSAEKLKLTFVQ